MSEQVEVVIIILIFVGLKPQGRYREDETSRKNNLHQSGKTEYSELKLVISGKSVTTNS